MVHLDNSFAEMRESLIYRLAHTEKGDETNFYEEWAERVKSSFDFVIYNYPPLSSFKLNDILWKYHKFSASIRLFWGKKLNDLETLKADKLYEIVEWFQKNIKFADTVLCKFNEIVAILGYMDKSKLLPVSYNALKNVENELVIKDDLGISIPDFVADKGDEFTDIVIKKMFDFENSIFEIIYEVVKNESEKRFSKYTEGEEK